MVLSMQPVTPSPELIIAHRKIGPLHPPLVIAEIGINHEGCLETAKQMVDAAARAGAEIVKHQTHVVDDEMSPAAKEVIPGNADVSIYEIMKRCALDESAEQELKRYVESKGMIFLSTPFSRAAADRLHRMGVVAYKIGSGELNNYPLLEHIARFGKPMIVSTGMNAIPSIKKAVGILRRHCIPYALLHTTNLYPTPFELVRLGAMQQLMEAFPDAVIGLSDHTINNNACISAMALGASIVERHFTDHMNRPGPDIVCSMDEAHLGDLLAASRQVFLMRGGKKETIPQEQVTMDFAFATVVAIRDIAPGETLTQDNIWVKRPGTGPISAEEFPALLGAKATVAIPNGTHLAHTMFCK